MLVWIDWQSNDLKKEIDQYMQKYAKLWKEKARIKGFELTHFEFANRYRDIAVVFIQIN
jgi:hypothetical protein